MPSRYSVNHSGPTAVSAMVQGATMPVNSFPYYSVPLPSSQPSSPFSGSFNKSSEPSRQYQLNRAGPSSADPLAADSPLGLWGGSHTSQVVPFCVPDLLPPPQPMTPKSSAGTSSFHNPVGLGVLQSMSQDALRPPKYVQRPKFSSSDDSLLIKLKEVDKLTWREIAKHFPGRTPGALQVRYCTKLKGKVNPWTNDDISMLMAASKEYDDVKWIAIAHKLGNKFTPEACYDKFLEAEAQTAYAATTMPKQVPGVDHSAPASLGSMSPVSGDHQWYAKPGESPESGSTP